MTEYPPILWVDTETTGLDPEWDQLLEIALVVTDSDLEPLGVYESVIHQPELLSMRDEVRQMHTRSGLLEDVRLHTGRILPVVYEECVKFVARNGVTTGSPVGGATVGFDKAFLRRDMPGLMRMVHYRVIDVSGLRELVARWHPEKKWVKKDQHRAKADILESIAELKHYRRVFGL